MQITKKLQIDKKQVVYSKYVYKIITPLLILVPYFAFASHATTDLSTPEGACSYIVNLLGHVAYFIQAVIGSLTVIMILIAAFYYMTAGDDAQKIKKAHTTITWAVVGTAVALLSFPLKDIIIAFIGGSVGSCSSV